MSKVIPTALLGLALATGGCATTKVKTTARWQCPAGTIPDVRQPTPNCLGREANALGEQATQEAPIREAGKGATAEEQAAAASEAATAGRVEFQRHVGFDTASSALTSGAKESLKQVAIIAQQDPDVTEIRIQGHADNTGSQELNDKLADTRAENVKAYLIELGVPDEKIHTESFGDLAPMASNDSTNGRTINRSTVVSALR